MRIHKMGSDELKEVLEFKNAAELMLERGKFSLTESFDEWRDMDDGDPDKIEIQKIQKRLCKEEDTDEEHLDGRILAYEYLKRKFTRDYNSRVRVHYANYSQYFLTGKIIKMENLKNNIPAYPLYVPPIIEVGSETILGMTLLDHFAGLAMQGIMASTVGQVLPDNSKIEIANESYSLATAMLEARKNYIK